MCVAAGARASVGDDDTVWEGGSATWRGFLPTRDGLKECTVAPLSSAVANSVGLMLVAGRVGRWGSAAGRRSSEVKIPIERFGCPGRFALSSAEPQRFCRSCLSIYGRGGPRLLWPQTLRLSVLVCVRGRPMKTLCVRFAIRANGGVFKLVLQFKLVSEPLV